MPWMFFKWVAQIKQGTGETWEDSLAEARQVVCIHPGSWDSGMTCLKKQRKSPKDPKETCHACNDHAGSGMTRPPKWIVEKAQSIAP